MNKNHISGLSEFLDKDGMWEALSLIVDNLPHGSGIDNTWGIHAPKSKNKVYFTNSYHCMDEYGGYDGWLDFKIVIDYHDFIRLVEKIMKVYRYKSDYRNYVKELAIALSKLQLDSFELTFSWADKRVARKYAELLREDLDDLFSYFFAETLPNVIQNL